MVVELDRSSIVKHQGMVSFIARRREVPATETSLTLYEQATLLCRTGEVWTVASKVDFSGQQQGKRNLEFEPRTKGPTLYPWVKGIARNPLVLENCKRSNSKLPLEVPVADGADKTFVLLAHETEIKEGLVYVWTKEFPTIDETSLDSSGKPFVVDGKAIVITKVVKGGGYSLVNWVSNCKEGTSAIAGIYRYSSDGVSQSADAIPKNRLSFSQNVPGSIGRGIHDFSCSLR
jgi:hypothetical protein